MKTRPRFLLSITVLAGALAAGGMAGHRAAARVAADGSPTVTVTATPSDTPSSNGTPAATDTPGFGATPTAGAGASTTPTAGAAASVSPTATRIAVKPIVHNPTPIVPPARKQITLPKPVVVELATKTKAHGLGQKQALLLANSFVPQLFIVAPTYVPKGFILQMIHVDPAQDQQTPAAAWLQYIPKSLSKVGSVFPSFYVNKRLGNDSIIYPGVKPQVVVINRGTKGVGVVKGTVIDIKPKNGYEVVHISWTRVSISYDVSSTIGISKLSIKDLLAVAATVQ